MMVANRDPSAAFAARRTVHPTPDQIMLQRADRLQIAVLHIAAQGSCQPARSGFLE